MLSLARTAHMSCWPFPCGPRSIFRSAHNHYALVRIAANLDPALVNADEMAIRAQTNHVLRRRRSTSRSIHDVMPVNL